MSANETKTILIETRHMQAALNESHAKYLELVPLWGVSSHIREALDAQMRHVDSALRDLQNAKAALDKVFKDIASGQDVTIGEVEYASLKAKQAFASNSHDVVLAAHEKVDSLAYAMRIIEGSKEVK